MSYLQNMFATVKIVKNERICTAIISPFHGTSFRGNILLVVTICVMFIIRSAKEIYPAIYHLSLLQKYGSLLLKRKPAQKTFTV